MNTESASIAVEVQVATESRPLPAAEDFCRWVNSALQGAGRVAETSTNVTVRIVDEAESEALNSSFRDVAKSTNVLAFPVEADSFPAHVEDEAELGDLVICAAVVIREAAEQAKPIEAHFAHMTVHGSLHLAGYDHLNDEQAAEMESLEKQILAGFGFPDPYQQEH